MISFVKVNVVKATKSKFFLKVQYKLTSSPEKDVNRYPSGVQLDNQKVFSCIRF